MGDIPPPTSDSGSFATKPLETPNADLRHEEFTVPVGSTKIAMGELQEKTSNPTTDELVARHHFWSCYKKKDDPYKEDREWFRVEDTRKDLDKIYGYKSRFSSYGETDTETDTEAKIEKVNEAYSDYEYEDVTEYIDEIFTDEDGEIERWRMVTKIHRRKIAKDWHLGWLRDPLVIRQKSRYDAWHLEWLTDPWALEQKSRYEDWYLKWLRDPRMLEQNSRYEKRVLHRHRMWKEWDLGLIFYKPPKHWNPSYEGFHYSRHDW